MTALRTSLLLIAAVVCGSTELAHQAASSTESAAAVGQRVMVAGCSYGGIDISNCNRVTGDYTGNDGSYDYKMNVCGISNAGGDCTAKGASICQFNPGTTQLVAQLGAFGAAAPAPGPTFSWISDSDHTQGVQMQFTNGDQCWQPGGRMITRTVNVLFPCTPGAGTASSFSVVEDTTTCIFTLKLNTQESCPGGNPSNPPGPSGGGGLGGGSIFLILLLVGTLVYIAAGCVYKRKKIGTTTMKESCPNNEFWFGLPGLVKDGFRYSFNMIRTGCKSGSNQQYEEL
jgi:hypothetical protein